MLISKMHLCVRVRLILGIMTLVISWFIRICQGLLKSNNKNKRRRSKRIIRKLKINRQVNNLKA